MRRSKTLARIRAGETVRMCALGHYMPGYVRLAAHFGYDCIWLDMEHRCLSDQDVHSLLQASHLHDVDIMVRPPTLEKTRLYRYLEDGAAGLMIPHVSDAAKARMLVDAVKFPPLGDRGLDGAGLDADYFTNRMDGVEAYLERANDETFLVVQIETPTAVENVEEIAAVDGIDGLFVGPGDLGLRLKYHDGPMTLESAFETVAAACKKLGKAWGTPVATREILQKRREQGGQILAHGGDFGAVMKMLEECSAAFD
jgi:2-keto-3-deoxy-L-rhamnonate aldolase RhmA